MVALCVSTPLWFFLRRRWSLYLMQVLAYCAAASWINLAFQMVEQRLRFGQSWRLTAAILGVVALLTILSGVLLNSRVIIQRYPK